MLGDYRVDGVATQQIFSDLSTVDRPIYLQTWTLHIDLKLLLSNTV